MNALGLGETNMCLGMALATIIFTMIMVEQTCVWMFEVR